jgi:drug/metabolite transporter (DMT)-like permease
MIYEDTMQREAALEAEQKVIASVRRNWRPEAFAGLSILFGAIGQLLLKGALLLATAHQGVPNISARLFEPLAGVLLGLGIYAVGTWFWLRAVSRAAISYLYPLSAAGYAVVALGGHVLFRESIHVGRWVGIGVITAGVALLTVSRGRGTP